MPFFRRARRIVSRIAAVTLLMSMITAGVAVHAPKALAAAGTVLFNQTFHDNTVDGPAGSVSLPTAPAASGNTACLTAAGNATANPLATCPTATDAQGSGKLRLTQNTTSQEGGVFASTSVPTSQGLDVTFNSYQYGGTQGADGLAFVLAAVNPANPVTPTTIGQSGGALGYSAQNFIVPGLSYGYLGVGFDVYGNFSNKYEGSGCTDPPNIAGPMAGEVVVRGPGNGGVGYCPLQSSAATSTSQKLTLRATARTGSVVPVEVVYNPSSLSVTTPSGLVVPGGDYDVHFTPVGGAARDLVGALPVVPSGLYPASWVNASGFPKQLAFGWVGSTGSVTDYHEIDNVMVSSLNPVPQLAVAQTSYAAATLAPGSPVTYTVAASSSGAAENQPVTVTETLPAGVLPVGASGTGWVCAAPSGQSISCTNSTSPFASGTITVNGVVTSSSVTPAVVQSGTSAVASSSDASPATSSSAPAGTVPTAPTVTGISPTNGAAGGNNDVKITGTGLSGATAIEIGTAAQFTAGTPITLNLCSSPAAGCFTVTSSTALDISAMPGHVAGAVTVKVVTLGTSASTAYTYNAGPALLFPAPPGGEAGVSYSDQLTVTGGTSPFTWSVSAGSLPAGVTLNASTGLLSGAPTTAGTYSFTVKVTDSSSLSSTEAVILTVIPGPSLNFPAPPSGWTHTVYGDTLTESGGTSPFTWSVSSGSLPGGISLSASGNLSGTPTATGTFAFTVMVTDANGQSATEATSLTVAAGVSTTFSAPPGAVIGSGYTDTLTATGGTTPYTWSVNSGTLPPGIALTSAGVLSGNPTTTGTYTFTVNVVDANNGIATTSISLVVSPAPVALTFSPPPSGTVGTAYTDTLTASGGTTPYTWSVSAGTLPAGLTLNASTGVISGTPTTAGTASFTVKVTDAKSNSATFATSITISGGALTIAATASTATTTPGGTVSYTITATNTGGATLTGATFTDALPDVLDDASYNSNAAATTGSVSFASPNLTWTGNLAAGASATITFSVTVTNPDTGNKSMASTVTSTTAGTNCASGSTDARCSSTVGVSVLTIALTANNTTVTPGTAVGYTITVTNSGTVAFTGAALTDSLSGVLDDATYNNDAAATAGSVSYTSPNLAWTGNLAAGASATITFSVTVTNPDAGNKILASTVTSATAGSNCASGSTDARCATSVTVLVPGLTMTVSAGASTTNPGSVVHYTVTVTNSGQTAYTGATLTDSLSGVLGDAAYNNDAAATAGSVSFTSPNLAWTGNLAVGASATITYSVTVSNPDTGDKILVSTVTSATAGSNCAAGSTDARCTATVTDLVPGLEIAVSAGSGTTTPGSVVHYTVTVTNTGQTAYTGATFTDPLSGVLDDAAYNNDAAATAGSVSFTSPNLAWIGNLAIGASATITFSVTVNNPDTGNKVLASTITSVTPGNNCTAGSGDLPCTATVDVAVLTITDSSNVSTTTPGSVVRFTSVFTNAGQVPYTGITIGSNITDVRDDATPNGDQTATSGTVSLTATGISWTGSIPVGGSVTITGSVTVNNPDTGNKVLTSAFSTTAAGSNCPSGGTDPRCSVSVTVLVPALSITVTANTAGAVPGQQVGYTLTITDSGQTPYTGAVVTGTLSGILDDAAYNNNAAATTGAVSYASPVLTWTGNLAAGASAVITYSVTVNNPDTGDKLLVTAAASTVAGSSCPPGSGNAGCSLTVPVLTPALTIALSAGVSTATPGQKVTYTATITDSGQTPYTGVTAAVALGGVIDDAAYNNDAATTSGTVTYASPALTWTGSLNPGGAATVTFSVTVSNPDSGDKILAASVTSAAAGSNCPSGGTDPGCASTVDVAVLTIVNSSNASTTTPGSVVRFTSVFTNAGQTPYTGITVSSNITDVLDDATPNGDQTATSGTLVLTATGISWTGSIPAGGSVTVTGTVTVNNPDTGNKVMASTLSTTAAGSNCPPGATDPRCSISVTVLTPGLSITQTANTAGAVPGQQVGYTVTITDSGQTPYTGAVVTSSLAGALDDAAYSNNAAATMGAVSYAAPVLTWTGNLAAGASAVITYTVTVNNPDTGDKLLTTTAASTAAGSSCPPGSGNTGCSLTVPILTPALTITKTASVSTATPGQQVTYTISVTDSGQTPYTGAAVTDNLSGVVDDAAYNNDAAATTGTVSYASPVLAWTGNLTPGQTATITYSATVHNPDTGDKILANTVTSATSGSNCASGSTDSRCTTTIPVVGAATLTFTQSTAANSTTAGSVVHYTITVANSGQSPYIGASYTDPLTGVLDDAAYNHDAAATVGIVTYTSPNLAWTGIVPANGTVTITFSATVNNPDTGNKILSSTLSSASVGSNCASGSTDPRCASTVTVSQLTITTTGNVSTTVPGGVVVYTTTLVNTGQTPYYGITMTAGGTQGNDGNSTGDETASSGTLSVSATGAVWTGDIPVGGTVTLIGSFLVNNPDTGAHLLAENVTSNALGSNCPTGNTDPRCSTSIPVLTPGLSITQTANAAAAVPGQQVTFTVTIADTGQTPYSGAVVTDTLSGILTDAVYNNDAAATGGAVSYAAPVLTWTGSLAAGASAVVTYSVTVNNPDTGQKALTTTAASTAAGSSCPPGSGNTGCSLTVPVLTPALTIISTASTPTAVPGTTVSYTVTIADTGQTPYTGAAFTDPLTGVLDDAAYNNDAAATAGSVSYASPVLAWTGNLNPGGTATITFSVTVSNPDTGNKILSSTLTSTAAGSNCASGSTDPRCASTVPVSDLVINFAASASTVTPGSALVYTATFTNTGQTPYFGISVSTGTVALAANVTSGGNVTASSGTLSIGATGTVWTGDIPVGGTVTITSPVIVDNPVTSTVLTATAVSTAPGSNCPPGSTDPRCTPVTQVLTPGLSITQTASTAAAVPGQQVTFTVTIADTGQTPYTGAVVTDSLAGALGDAAYDNDAAATGGTVSYASPVLTWTGNLSPGQTATIAYSVTVDNPDNGDKVLGSTLASTAAGSSCLPASGNAGCSLSIPVLTPALTITKTASVATATAGQQVTYTVTVTDSGQTPYTGAAVTDNLSGVLDDATYNNDGAATAGSVSYASPVLAWTGNLTPGQTATITYSVTVNNPDTGDKILANTVTSATSGSNCASGSTDPRCTASINVAVLTIVNTANASSTTPGSTVSYTVTITDTGQTSYDGATVTDPLAGITDDAAYNSDGAATSGAVGYASANLTWTGDLVPGQAATITFTASVNNPDTGNKSLTSTVTSTAAGSTCPPSGPAAACTSTVTVLIPALTITKTATTATTTPGSAVGYTITVADTGPTPYTAATVTDDLSGLLTDAAYSNNAAATTGTVSYTSPILTWTGALTPGQTATITYTVTVNNPDTGDKHLVNTVTSVSAGSTCPAGSTNPACTATVTDLIPALTITKTATVAATTPGSAVGYTITVADSGQTPYTAATVTDSLSGVLGNAAYNRDASTTAGSVSYASPVLTWTGALAPGATATITYTVTVNNPDTGSAALTNTVTSAAPGSSCPAAAPASGCTATVAVAAGPLSITVPATASLGSAAPGGTLSAGLGAIQVTDDRGFGAGWTATVSATSFATGTATPAETIPVTDASYNITALSQVIGPATFTPVPVTQLSPSPQPVVSATNVMGNTTVTWNPILTVTVPSSAIGGPYTATITHSVS